MNWIPLKQKLPPDGVVVNTKIDDADGCRNERTLKLYVYYTPTHWAPHPPKETE